MFIRLTAGLPDATPEGIRQCYLLLARHFTVPIRRQNHHINLLRGNTPPNLYLHFETQSNLRPCYCTSSFAWCSTQQFIERYI